MGDKEYSENHTQRDVEMRNRLFVHIHLDLESSYFISVSLSFPIFKIGRIIPLS